MRTRQQSIQDIVPGASMLIALTVIILFSCSQKAFAQQWSTSGNNISNTNSGNVGVGTTSPGVKLDILSPVSLIARFGSTAGANSQVLIDAPAGYNSNLTLQRGGVSKWFMANVASNDRLSFIESTGAVETLTLLQNGFVGIGTTTPVYKLDLNGALNVRGGAFYLRQSSGLAGNEGATFSIGATINNEASFALSVYRAGVYTSRLIVNQGGHMLLQPNGDAMVGIGTSSPLALLDVRNSDGMFYAGFGYGTNKETFIRAGNSTTGVLHVGDLNTTKTLLQENGGNVGIGTPTPNQRLDVQGGKINASGGLCIAGDCKTAWSQVGGALSSVFGRTGTVVAATNDYTWAQIDKTTSSLGDLQTRNAGDLNAGTVPIARIGLSGTPGASTFLRGDNTWAPVPSSQWTDSANNISFTNGNVGIGTTNPVAKLEVTGNINVTGTGNITAAGTIEGGNVKAKYQDVAEWVESSQKLPAGTLVVLDHTKSNQVIASSQAYDTRVAGVISERPGITLGEGGANKVLVATTGRVRLMVDASKGPIHIGDLLVTSNIPGVAMKSEVVNIGGVQIHRPGTLVGKALEPLAKGQGTILVLLSLQ